MAHVEMGRAGVQMAISEESSADDIACQRTEALASGKSIALLELHNRDVAPMCKHGVVSR
jgi:hypothetical protein